MAVDFIVVKPTTDAMHRKISELSQLVDEGASGGYESEYLKGKSFTADEKTSLTDQYDTLKTDLVKLFNKLP